MTIDPIVEYGSKNILPLQWHELDAEHHSNKQVRRMMNESAEFGLKSGMSFPVHTTRGEAAMLSFASNSPPENNAKHMQYVAPHLMYFACHLHESVMRIFHTTQDVESIDLTARERECLLWAAEGKSPAGLAAMPQDGSTKTLIASDWGVSAWCCARLTALWLQ